MVYVHIDTIRNFLGVGGLKKMLANSYGEKLLLKTHYLKSILFLLDWRSSIPKNPGLPLITNKEILYYSTHLTCPFHKRKIPIFHYIEDKKCINCHKNVVFDTKTQDIVYD